MSGSVGLNDLDLRFPVPVPTNAWRHIPSTGDLDGDGLEDIVYCDHRTTIPLLDTTSHLPMSFGVTAHGMTLVPVQSHWFNIFNNILATGSGSVNSDGYMLRAACGIMPDWNGDGKDGCGYHPIR